MIPIVNPDGFNASREAGEIAGRRQRRGRQRPDDVPRLPPERVPAQELPLARRRRGRQLLPAVGRPRRAGGVDPNRNYGGFWGGPGASDDPTARGPTTAPAPFSEPETQNIRELVSPPPGDDADHQPHLLQPRPAPAGPRRASRDPVDEPHLQGARRRDGRRERLLSQKGYELYDTTGTTEDWSYNATGGLGFTFEIYCDDIPDLIDDRCGGNFHPTYPNVVEEYEGTRRIAQAIGGGGNREAYFLALREHDRTPTRHSVLRGDGAPGGDHCGSTKTFQTPTSVASPATFEDQLETEMKVPRSGRFDYHINPSTRPLVAQASGPPGAGSRRRAETFNGASDPATNMPCAVRTESTDPNCFDDHPFTDPAGRRRRQRRARPSGSTGPRRPATGTSTSTATATATGPRSTPAATSSPTSSPARRPVRPTPATRSRRRSCDPRRATVASSPASTWPGWRTTRRSSRTTARSASRARRSSSRRQTETWKLTCLFADQSRLTREITIARGERRNLDLSDCGTRGGGGGKDRCRGKAATLVGSRQARPDRRHERPRRDRARSAARTRIRGSRRQRPDLRQGRQGQGQRRRRQGQDQGRRRQRPGQGRRRQRPRSTAAAATTACEATAAGTCCAAARAPTVASSRGRTDRPGASPADPASV